MLPLSSSRSSTLAMSNFSYLASRTPSAMFSKSQNSAMLVTSLRCAMTGAVSARVVVVVPERPFVVRIVVIPAQRGDFLRDVARKTVTHFGPTTHSASLSRQLVEIAIARFALGPKLAQLVRNPRIELCQLFRA